MGRDEVSVFGGCESVVDEQYHPAVAFGADDPPRGLEHAIHPGIDIGEPSALLVLLVKIGADRLTLIRELREPDPHDHGTD